MIRLDDIGDPLIHAFVYPGHINGFSAQEMSAFGGWMNDMHADRSGDPLDPEIRITVIASPDKERATRIAAACRIDTVYDRIADLDPASVDGVLILEDDGTKHPTLALPFLEQGKFVFLDKPVAVSADDASTLASAARRHGARLTGGSALRYSPRVAAAREACAAERPGSVTISGPGRWFNYACHTVEVLEALFGLSGVELCAIGKEERGAALLRWPDGMTASVSFGGGHQPLFILRAEYRDRTETWVIDDARQYYLGLSQTIVSVAAGRADPPPADSFVEIARVLEQGGALLS